MYLEKARRDKLYELLFYLMEYTNRKYKINPKVLGKLKVNHPVNIMEIVDIRETMWSSNEILEEYIQKNPDKLGEADLETIKSWKNRVAGEFFLMKYTKEYAFLYNGKEVYGILGISNEISDIIPAHNLPVYLSTVLLPFDHQIVYDTLLVPYTIEFGSDIRKSLNEEYREAKLNGTIVTSLDAHTHTPLRVAYAGKPKAKAKYECYEIKVSVRDLRPPVWRRLQIPSGITFHELNIIIQLAFGWSGAHMYDFELGDSRKGTGMDIYLIDPSEEGVETRNSATETIDAYFHNYDRMRYTYDFGDNWVHDILIEKRLETDVELKKPLCIKAKMADLPEDCGGPWQYQAYLNGLMDKEEKADYEEMIGKKYSIENRENVDIEVINERLEDYKEYAAWQLQ